MTLDFQELRRFELNFLKFELLFFRKLLLLKRDLRGLDFALHGEHSCHQGLCAVNFFLQVEQFFDFEWDESS